MIKNKITDKKAHTWNKVKDERASHRYMGEVDDLRVPRKHFAIHHGLEQMNALRTAWLTLHP